MHQIAILYQQLLARHKPLQHYFHHYLTGTLGLLIAVNIYGSVTIWEVILVYMVTYLLFLDEFFYAVIHYIDKSSCRNTVNAYLSQNTVSLFAHLHEERKYFREMIFHNILTYSSLWLLWLLLLIQQQPVLWYMVSGMLTHLTADIINDVYEKTALERWIWPVKIFNS